MLISVAMLLIGCSAGGGQVDTEAVKKQTEKEAALQKEANKKLPPGEGPSN